MHTLSTNHRLTHRRLRGVDEPGEDIAKTQSTRYGLTVILAGITADDYLQWVRDPHPPARTDLTLMSVRAAPPGDRIELELLAHGKPPTHRDAAIAVGFPITPEVIGIHRTPLPASTHTQSRTPEPRGS